MQVMAVNPGTTHHPQGNHQKPTWILCFLILFPFVSPSLIYSPITIPYSDHCSSIVPESSPTFRDGRIYKFFETGINYYYGGDRILGTSSSESPFDPQRHVNLGLTQNVFQTNTAGVYKVQAYLTFLNSEVYYYPPDDTTYRRALIFTLQGFWSRDSGKLCMVGTASWTSKEGNEINLDAVLKLNCPVNSNISTSLVSGKLESTNFYFEPISILAFTQSKDYKYTLVSDGIDSSGMGILQNQPIRDLHEVSFCRTLQRKMNTFELEQDCGFIGQGIRKMSLNMIECSEKERKVQYLVGFGSNSRIENDRSFDPTTTLVAEGSWDGDENQMFVVGCRILDPTGGNAHVGDCSIRLSLSYSDFWSYENGNNIVGEIWSTNKTGDESGYFERIIFRGGDNIITGSRAYEIRVL